MKRLATPNRQQRESFIQYWYQETRCNPATTDQPTFCRLRKFLRTIGRGLQCQWMRD